MTSPTIDVRVDAQLQQLLDAVRVYSTDDVRPTEAKLRVATGPSERQAAIDRLRAAARARGIYTPQLPEAWGGLGIGVLGMALITQQCGASPLTLLGLNAMAPDEGTMHLLLHTATSEQRDRFLRPLIDGHARSCFAMTEPDVAGSDPTNITTTAIRDGDEWILNGHKWMITQAADATFAIVVAKTTAGEQAGHRGLSLLLVPTDTPGWHIEHQPDLLGAHTPGGHAQIDLRDVRVPAANLLGNEGDGFQIAQQRLARGRVLHAMRWIATAQHAVELAARRATGRHAFGKPLAEHQAVQFSLADCAIDLHASRLMVLHSAWKIEHGHPHRHEVSIVKTFAAEAFGRIMDRVVQIYGSHGLTTDEPIADWWAQARAARIADGPSEMHRMVIARDLLERSRNGDPNPAGYDRIPVANAPTTTRPTSSRDRRVP